MRSNISISIFIIILLSITNLISAEPIIGSIEFRGNYLISDQELRSSIFSAEGDSYDQKRVNSDLDRVIDLHYPKKILIVVSDQWFYSQSLPVNRWLENLAVC